MTAQYRYIRINDYHFCLEQSIRSLAWVLFFKRNDLYSICEPWSKKKLQGGASHYLRHIFRIFKMNIQLLAYFSLCKHRVRTCKTEVTLPVCGHICLPVHQGHKVFDLKRGMVAKVFYPAVARESIEKEVERLQAASEIHFAPDIGKRDKDNRWYEEEYIAEFPPSSYKTIETSDLLNSFIADIIPCLVELLTYKKALSVQTSGYVADQMNKVSNTQVPDSDSGKDVVIRRFLDNMTGQISEKSGTEVYLGFSHGDFCPANIMKTKKGIKVLDWESTAYRSVLFDFFSFFFYRPVCLDIPIQQMHIEMGKAFSELISHVSLVSPECAKHIARHADTYRRIFYIERLCMLRERSETDRNLNIVDFMVRYINAFSSYEELDVTRNAESPESERTLLTPPLSSHGI